MRASDFPLYTLKELPAEAEMISHRLMLKAGVIRRLASGLYTWMPVGLRVLRKVEAIVREEMNAAGALELLMPAIQPASLWRESKRWDEYGPELLRISDRHDRDFVFGPTHEEVVTDLARGLLNSYRQLPVNFYQIQTKFRDEIRPRFGVMRAREFVMKDAYSFHADAASLDETYEAMFRAYSRIFTRLGLDFRVVEADTGAIGGNASHEFHILAESGEDSIAFSNDGDYAANLELAPCPEPAARAAPAQTMDKVHTPGLTTIDSLSEALDIPQTRSLKALFAKGADGGVVALFVRGDHQLNGVKAANHPLLASPFEFASPEEIIEAVGCPPGSLGPLGLDLPIVVDRDAAAMANFCCGANEESFHYTGVNWGRDLPEPETADLRNLCEGEASPDGRGTVKIRRGIEAGHIFKLGKKYSEQLNFTILAEDGKPITPTMGCYGIGVSRIVAAAIEQNHDDDGIVWPETVSPFDVVICPMRYADDPAVRETAERLHDALAGAGLDVLLDDRNARAGAMFADMDLLGIPLRLVVGARNLSQGLVEYKLRRSGETGTVAVDGCPAYALEKVKELGAPDREG